MRRQRRSHRLLALIAGFALLTAACGGDDDDATTDDPSGSESEGAGGTLVDLQNFAQGDPDNIDPQLAAVLQGSQISYLMFDGLTEFDFTGDEPELVAQVAESWDTEDGKTWVFHIKEGQEFSDGTPVLPSSFKRGWERATDPALESEVSYHLLPIVGASEMLEGTATELTGVTADDEALELTVELVEPFYDWPAVVTHAVFSPAPESVEELDDQGDWEQGVMVGNGPYMQEDAWEHDVAINLVRNDRWNGGIYGDGTEASLDAIEFRISAGVDSAYSDFEAGNGQTAIIPSGTFETATASYPNSTEGSMGVYFFAVNQESQLGGDENLKLRQAIAMAIDREAINDTVYDGSRRLPTGITPSEVPGYEDGLCGDLCEYDPEAAQALVEEWRGEGGSLDHPIKVNFNADSGHEDLVAIVQQNLVDIGLEAELDPRDPTNYFSEMREGACELCRAGWIWDYPLYDSPIFAQLHSSSINADNLARYNNPEVDTAIDGARSAEDEEERAGLYRQAEEAGLQDVAIIPVNWYNNQVVYSEDVGNWFMTPLQFALYEQVTVSQ